MTIADCIQEEDGTFFCSKVCAEKHQPAEPDNQTELEIYYDDWSSQQLGEVPDLRRDFPFRLGQTRSIRRVSELLRVFLLR